MEIYILFLKVYNTYLLQITANIQYRFISGVYGVRLKSKHRAEILNHLLFRFFLKQLAV